MTLKLPFSSLVSCLTAFCVLANCPLRLASQVSLTIGAGIGGGVVEAKPIPPTHYFDEFVSANSALAGFEQSVGSNLQTRIRLAYDWSDYVKFDLDVAYYNGFLRGSTFDSTGETFSSFSVKSSRLQFTPGVVLSLGNRRFSPFLRLGAALPTRYDITYEATELRNNGQQRQQVSLRALMSLGLSSSLGLTYRISSRLRIFYEASYLYQSAALRGATLQAYQVDGQDRLATLAAYQSEAVFSNRLEPGRNHPDSPDFDQDLPLELEALNQDASLLSLNLGLVFSFN